MVSLKILFVLSVLQSCKSVHIEIKKASDLDLNEEKVMKSEGEKDFCVALNCLIFLNFPSDAQHTYQLS
jgi:hypothetical protein